MNIYLSTIIPTFNRFELTKRAIASYAKQTISTKDRELIIVDDRSTDGSFEQLRNWLAKQNFDFKVRLVQTPQNGGPGPARNYAVSLIEDQSSDTTWHYLTFLDADDEYFPQYLQTRIDTITKWEGYPIFHGGMITNNGETHVPDKDDPTRKIAIKDTSQGATLVIRLSFFQQLNGYRNMYGEDGDLLERSTAAGVFPYNIVTQDYRYYRDLEDSITNIIAVKYGTK